jgi:membrane protein implicated in regulation of membrane protease activity
MLVCRIISKIILEERSGKPMLTFYVICFWVGLILTLITTLFGGHGSHTLQMEVDMDSGHSSQGNGHSPINFTTILAFLTGFGGTGYILLKYNGLSGILILLIALVIGFVIAAALFMFLSKVLMRDEHVMKAENYQIEGTLGTVTTAIPLQGTGELKYVLGGTTRSIGVKEQHGQEVSRGTKVVIVGMEKGIAIVTLFEELE